MVAQVQQGALALPLYLSCLLQDCVRALLERRGDEDAGRERDELHGQGRERRVQASYAYVCCASPLRASSYPALRRLLQPSLLGLARGEARQ